MNDIWSKNLQGIKTLDLSREVRFSDDKKDLILDVLGLEKGMKIAEIGCGPGALSRKIAKWIGSSSKIIGIDRDTNFINYANKKANEEMFNNLEYIEGDALKIPFKDNEFNACYSHTLIEHVPNKEFLIEQKRICKPGGKVSCMITLGNKTICSNSVKTPIQTKREIELMKPFISCFEKADNKYLNKHWMGIDILASLFTKVGYKNISINSLSLPVVIDDDKNDLDMKKLMVEDQQRSSFLESIEIGQSLLENKLSNSHIDELISLINKRFDLRWNMVINNEKIWDYKIYTVLIISGIV